MWARIERSTGASYRCAATTWSSPRRARLVPRGKRARSRSRWTIFARLCSCPGRGSRAWKTSTPGCSRSVLQARKQAHPEFQDKTIFEVFEAERKNLVGYRGRFDAYRSISASVSKTCLVRFDNNKYSVMAKAVGRPVDI